MFNLVKLSDFFIKLVDYLIFIELLTLYEVITDAILVGYINSLFLGGLLTAFGEATYFDFFLGSSLTSVEIGLTLTFSYASKTFSM